MIVLVAEIPLRMPFLRLNEYSVFLSMRKISKPAFRYTASEGMKGINAWLGSATNINPFRAALANFGEGGLSHSVENP